MLLDKTLDSKNKLKVIRELCLHENWEYSIDELSKNTGVHRVLLSGLIPKLVSLNVVKIKTKGKSKLISINKDNFFVQKILIELFKREKDLPLLVAQNFVKKLKLSHNVISVILYGSAAKQTFSFKSDIDLMIISKNEIRDKQRIEEAINQFSKKGILITCDFITLDEFKKLHREKEAAISALVEDHRTICGKKLLEII